MINIISSFIILLIGAFVVNPCYHLLKAYIEYINIHSICYAFFLPQRKNYRHNEIINRYEFLSLLSNSIEKIVSFDNNGNKIRIGDYYFDREGGEYEPYQVCLHQNYKPILYNSSLFMELIMSPRNSQEFCLSFEGRILILFFKMKNIDKFKSFKKEPQNND